MRAERVLSVEGVWDMLGWDEARKQQERARLDKEAASDAQNDPVLTAARALSSGTAPSNG
jgi:hypothetical protein